MGPPAHCGGARPCGAGARFGRRMAAQSGRPGTARARRDRDHAGRRCARREPAAHLFRCGEEPSFSPDGRQIAYVEIQCDSTAGRVGCTAGLRLQDVHSAQTTTIATAEHIFHPFWTADGEWVLVILQPKGGEFGTRIVPRHGGSMRRLGPGTLVAFSATGDTILLAALAAPGAPRYVRRVRAATGETIDSIPLARDLTDLQGLLPSPDGRWIVLRLADRLLLATPDRRVTVSSLMFVNAGSLRWDPRGDALYAVVPVLGNSTATKLVRARVDGRRGTFASKIETVLNLGSSAGSTFDIAPDGSTLVHTGGTVTITLWALDLDARPASPRGLGASTSWLGSRSQSHPTEAAGRL